MNASDVLQGISERLGTTANAKSVFGEPIQAGDKTVVPVAKVAYGFGGGFGSGKDGAHPGRDGEGGGGGGGVRAFPAGALEITSTGTRFVPFTSLAQLVPRVAVAFAAGVMFSSLVLRRRRQIESATHH
jgi:uncharacterized spore protein YtfJ